MYVKSGYSFLNSNNPLFQKKKDKNEDAFKAKCQKVWGMKKCPVSCGFCPEAANPSVILLPPLEFTNDS